MIIAAVEKTQENFLQSLVIFILNTLPNSTKYYFCSVSTTIYSFGESSKLRINPSCHIKIRAKILENVNSILRLKGYLTM